MRRERLLDPHLLSQIVAQPTADNSADPTQDEPERIPQNSPLAVGLDLVPLLDALGPLDRQLADVLLLERASFRAASRRTGIPLGSIKRRRDQIVSRLQNPTVLTLHRAKGILDPLMRDIGLRYHLHRQTLTRISAELGLTRRNVSERLHFIRGYARAASRRRTV